MNVTTSGGNITFVDTASTGSGADDFAKAIVLTGNPAFASSITASDDGTAPAIGTVLKATGGVYAIDASVLTSGITYKLTIQVSNFVKEDANSSAVFTNISPVVYYIKVN